MKLLKYLLPSKWTTVWTKQIQCSRRSIFTNYREHCTPVVLFLEKSNKGKLRFRVTDGKTTSEIEENFVRANIVGVNNAYLRSFYSTRISEIKSIEA